MNLLDFIILIPLVFAFARGIYKGLINELASLAALVLGIMAAYKFADDLYLVLAEHVENPGSWAKVLSYVLIFTGVVIIIFIISRVLTKAAGFLALGLINRILGGIFGLAKMLIILLIMTYFLNPFFTRQELYKKELFSRSLFLEPLLGWSSAAGKYFEIFAGPESSPKENATQGL